MDILKVFALRGPNIWANFPVLEAWVDLKELKDSSSDELPGFNARLMAWLPGMIEHRCSIGERGGFFERLRRGTYQAHILEHVTLELQSLAGSEVGFGRARESLGEGVYKVAIEYHEEQLARECLATARELCLAAVFDRPFDAPAEIGRLRELNYRIRLGPSTRSIVDAAVARGIPFRRLNEGSLIQFGHGIRQRRIMAAETDRTGAIAQEIAQDKDLTRSLLRSIGAPVPDGRPVTDANDAWLAAQQLGGPVVVKPRYGNQGRGVATNLTTREQVLAGYDAARREGDSVVVERFVSGDDYRLLIVGGRLIAAARRDPAQVVGDGRRSVAQLVERVNADPRRADGHATSLSKIPLDAVSLGVLAEQSLELGSVPAAGQIVLLRRNGNLSTGGVATDVTDLVHPELAERAIEAVRMVGLDIAGVDILARDIGRPLEGQEGAIVEINAAPGLRMHLEPSFGVSRPVGEAIVGALYGPRESGRIPLVGVTGTNGKTTTTRLIAHLIEAGGQTVGMACTDGVFIAGRRIDAGDCSGPQSARAVLMNPRVEAAVLETARGGILREGLGFDRCDVAVVTNIAEGDHLGLAGIDTPEDLARVKRTLVEAVAPQGAAVLKADDPLVAAMAAHCPGAVIFFAREREHAVMQSHLAAGGRCAFVEDDRVVLASAAERSVLLPLDRIPLAHQGRVAFQVENVLAAAAAGWALGLAHDQIRQGLESFSSNMATTPGRFNLLKIGGATVIVDYGHNTSALVALVEAIAHFPHERRLAVYSSAGDRRDQDLIDQGRLLGQNFDQVILYEDHYKRGRADGEIMRLFSQGLTEGARVKQSQQVHGALKAVELALNGIQPGDLLLIQADVVDETVDYIKAYLQPHLHRRDTGHALGILDGPSAPTTVHAGV